MIDLTWRCPTCGQRADMRFVHGDDWKKPIPPLYKQTDAQLRASVNEFTEDDPPPYVSEAPPSDRVTDAVVVALEAFDTETLERVAREAEATAPSSWLPMMLRDYLEAWRA